MELDAFVVGQRWIWMEGSRAVCGCGVVGGIGGLWGAAYCVALCCYLCVISGRAGGTCRCICMGRMYEECWLQLRIHTYIQTYV